MAPIITLSNNTFSAPLADFFFSAGIESSRIFDAGSKSEPVVPHTPIIDQHPTESDLLRTESAPASPSSPASPSRLILSSYIFGSTRVSPDTSSKRARLSYDVRKSLGNLAGLQEDAALHSNRSSATVRPAPHAEKDSRGSLGLSDPEFEEALRRFTSERDSFLEGIQFGQAPLDRPRQKAKTHRMSGGGHKREGSYGGSLRKRFSTINPLSRQSTSTKRSSKRISKRLSGYNSVIPLPQQFQSRSDTHPLRRTYEPVLLDQYPSRDALDKSPRQTPFPDHVPMFVFPNDINVVSADEKPKSTWHGFTMTKGDGSKLHGMCLITWIPLKSDAAEELELQCERWRNANMSDEERDMAKDLGERLVSERAKLSELLAILPTLESGSDEREAHEEDISTVEERIHLLVDALRPVRHATASKIDGLTDSDTGFWIPRAYGVLGRDSSYMSFWKEWLRAIAIPMTNGGVLRVPPSSPRVGVWQPLEKYVVNLCTEAPIPMTSITQVELAVRELRLYARKEATNEIPGSRTTDLYPLFRCLDIQDVVVLMEYVLSESRIILISSHASMLHLACSAITQLLYPLQWAGSFIPVLPARLVQALDAPCPYIIGIERRCENLRLPEDDYVLVDLDQGCIEATAPPTSLPRQQRRKLISILQLAAPHKLRYGVSNGPPKYAMEAYPFNAFSSENPSVFEFDPPRSTLAHLANINSSSFGIDPTLTINNTQPLFNAFSQPPRSVRSFSGERPLTRCSSRETTPPSPSENSPLGSFVAPLSRHDSGLAIQSSLREKRSGIFDMSSYMKRNSSLYIMPLTTSRLTNTNSNVDSRPASKQGGLYNGKRRKSIPFLGHSYAASISTMGNMENYEGSTYAPSMNAHSSLAASSIMALNGNFQPVSNTGTTTWSEGHCLQWQATSTDRTVCSVCNEKSNDGIYKCEGCGMTCHTRCSEEICLVCPSAFHPDQIITGFVRCFASLFCNYRRFLSPSNAEDQKSGVLYRFNMDGLINSAPHDHAEYLGGLRNTQAFNQFIHTRTTTPASDPTIRLFDDLILSKRTRSRTATNFFTASKPKPFNIYQDPTATKHNSPTPFLSDTTDHIWRTATAPSVVSRNISNSSPCCSASYSRRGSGCGEDTDTLSGMAMGVGVRSWVGRVPAKLDPRLMQEPRALQGAPRVESIGRRIRRKEVPTASSSSVSASASASSAGKAFLGRRGSGGVAGVVC